MLRWLPFVLLLWACGDDAAPEARCDPPAPSAPGECASDAECGAGDVCRLGPGGVDGEPATLACGAPTAGGEPGDACVVASGCARGLCAMAGTCVAACRDASDCRASERCAIVWLRTDADEARSRWACTPELSLPAGVLGSVEARVAPAGASEVVVAGGADPVWIALRGCGAQVSATSLTADGRSLWPGDPAANPVWSGGSVITALVPNGPAVAPAGALALGVESTAAGLLEVARVTAPAGAGGVLDLDLFYVGVRGLEVADPLPEPVASAVERAAELLSAAGITVGVVRQHQVIGALEQRLRIVDFTTPRVSEELDELMSLSAGVAGPSVAVFLVRSLDFHLALSGGVPGPLGRPGRPGSGIALGAEVLTGDSELGRALAHELGHHLGLFHTTEADGSSIEPLPDTPTCPAEADVDGDGTFAADECDAADGGNLMFWALDGGGALSADQARVLGAAPILR